MHLKINEKVIEILNDFWKGFWKDFRSQTAFIFEAYGLHFGSIFRSGVFVKIRTARRREHQNQGSGGFKCHPEIDPKTY